MPLSTSDRILAELARGPATCAAVGKATGIHVRTVSNVVNKLVHSGLAHHCGEEMNGHGNMAFVYGVKASKTTLLDEYWTRAASVEYGEGA